MGTRCTCARTHTDWTVGRCLLAVSATPVRNIHGSSREHHYTRLYVAMQTHPSSLIAVSSTVQPLESLLLSASSMRADCKQASKRSGKQITSSYRAELLYRAYIHHLLDAREMLGTMLLEYHNTHHLQRFMVAIRASVQAGTLPSLRSHFEDAYATEAQAPPPAPKPRSPRHSPGWASPRAKAPRAASPRVSDERELEADVVLR